MPESRPLRAALCCALACLLAVLAGCGSGPGSSGRSPTTPVIAYPSAVAAGSIVLFDIDTRRLVTFDPARRTVTATGNAPQTFQYPFPGRQDLLTSGSSTDYGFELLRVTGGEIRRLAAVEGRRGLFPLASDGGRILLVRQDYDAGGRPSRQQVVRLDGTSLVAVPRLDHAGIAAGALIGGELSYTVLAGKSRYDLRRVDLDDPASRPRTVRSGLRDATLERFDGRVVVGSRVVRSHGSTVVGCDGYCYFADGPGIVVQVAPDADNERRLRVLDPLSRRTLGSVTGAVVGFRVDHRSVEVFGEGLDERISLTR